MKNHFAKFSGRQSYLLYSMLMDAVHIKELSWHWSFVGHVNEYT